MESSFSVLTLYFRLVVVILKYRLFTLNIFTNSDGHLTLVIVAETLKELEYWVTLYLTLENLLCRLEKSRNKCFEMIIFSNGLSRKTKPIMRMQQNNTAAEKGKHYKKNLKKEKLLLIFEVCGKHKTMEVFKVE